MSQAPPSKGSKKSGGPKGPPKPTTAPGRPAPGSAPGGTAKKGPPDPAKMTPSDAARKATSDAGTKGFPSKIPGPAPVPGRAPSKQASITSSKSTDDGFEQGKAARDVRLGKVRAEDTGYMPPPPTAARSGSGSIRSKDSRETEGPVAGHLSGGATGRPRGKFELAPSTGSGSERTHTSDLQGADELVQQLAEFQNEATAGIRRDQRLKGLPTATHSGTRSDDILGREEKIGVPSIPSTRERERIVRGESGPARAGSNWSSSAQSSSSKVSSINFEPQVPSTESGYKAEPAQYLQHRLMTQSPGPMGPPGTTPYVPVEERPGKSGTRQTTGNSGRSYRTPASGSSKGDRFENQARELGVSRPSSPLSPIALRSIAIPAVGKRIPRDASGQMTEELKDYREMLTDALRPAFDFCGQRGWQKKSEEPANHHLPHATTYEAALALGRQVLNELYDTELVREFDLYVAEIRGQKAHYFKRLAEDDAQVAARHEEDGERYPKWRDLGGFVSWEMNREYGKTRLEIADRMIRDNVHFSEAERRIRNDKAIKFMGLKGY